MPSETRWFMPCNLPKTYSAFCNTGHHTEVGVYSCVTCRNNKTCTYKGDPVKMTITYEIVRES